MQLVTPTLTEENADTAPPLSESVPSGSKTDKVDDLNGQFAPQSGIIQPDISTVPEKVQVEIHHPADDNPDKRVTVIVDDWAYVAASVSTAIPVCPLAPTEPKVPDTKPEAESIELLKENHEPVDSPVNVEAPDTEESEVASKPVPKTTKPRGGRSK